MALALPHVEQGAIHGATSLKVRGKLLCCPALHSSAEPNTLAIRIDYAERAKLMEANPSAYYVTDHYLNYTMVLVRLSRIDRNSLKKLLGVAWKFVTGSKAPRNPAQKRGRIEKGLTNRRNRLSRQARLVRGTIRAFLRAVHLNVRDVEERQEMVIAMGHKRALFVTCLHQQFFALASTQLANGGPNRSSASSA
jgi:hypothetical protein